jgi:hypothetical protein
VKDVSRGLALAPKLDWCDSFPESGIDLLQLMASIDNLKMGQFE